MSNYTNTFAGAAKDAAEDIILATAFDTQFDAIGTMSATKANKVASATVDNIATTDANGDLKDGGVTIAAVKALLYPVGTIYQSTVATSPNTLFGFGTWVQISGRVLVGEGTGAGLTARTAGAEIGQEDAIIPAHTHTATQAAHTHVITTNSDESGSPPDVVTGANGGGVPGTATTGSATPVITVATATGGESVTDKNLPAALVVYMWERTV